MAERFKAAMQSLRPHLLPILVLAVVTCAVYGRIIGHQFLSNWDDNRYILENADVQGMSWPRIQAIFSRYYVGNYAPVHMLSYMFDYVIWGLWAGGYLLTNLVLHLVNSLLLYRLFFQLVGRRFAAWAGAMVFLLHPVQVETVVWISQRKNLLAMFFFLISWELYRAYRDNQSERRRRLFYTASLITVLLALLAKSIAVIFPVVIILFDYCYPPLKPRHPFIDKLPYLLVAIAAAVVAILSQTPDYSEWGAGGGRAGYHGGSAWATILTMLPVFCTYLRQIVWPSDLSALYNPTIYKNPDSVVLGSFLLLGGVLYLLFRLYRYDRSLAFWPLYAIIALIPVSQIVPLVTLMNDRYLYFPLIGVAALVAYAVDFSSRKLKSASMVMPVAVILLILLSVVSFQRVAVWRDATTLWRDTVKKRPNNPVAWEALGESLHYTGTPNYQEAIAAYRRAIELSPPGNGGHMSHYNLGIAYTNLGDYANAEKVLRKLLQESPNNVMGWAALGDVALRRYLYNEAETCYRKALGFQPEAVQVHQKIGNLMVILERLDEARDSYLKIEEIQERTDPHNAYELARIEALTGDTGASITWLQESLERGYNNYNGIMADEELVPIMADARFAELVSKYFPR